MSAVAEVLTEQMVAQKESADLVIPSVPGEFYNYSSTFTEDRSLYVLMKCKANKNRPLASAVELGNESNLVFLFDGDPRACSVKSAQASGLLEGPGGSFGDAWVAVAEINIDDFHVLRSSKDVGALVQICLDACTKREDSVALEEGSVVAVMTATNKYGLFYVRTLTQESIVIDACHIQL